MFDTNNLLNFDNNYPCKNDALVIPQVFSFYKAPVKNVYPSKQLTLLETYKLIKSNRYQRQTEMLRGITDLKEARRFKASNFDYVTYSGTFTSRKNDGLIQHSGLMVLDFDKLDDVMALKKALIVDEYFEPDMLFVSPSGNGLKLVTTIDLNLGSHLDWFMAIADYVRTTYQLEIDASGKDVSRAAFLPFDENVYINPIYFSDSFSQPINTDNHEII